VASGATKCGGENQGIEATLAELLAIARRLETERQAADDEEQGYLDTAHAAAYMDMTFSGFESFRDDYNIPRYKLPNGRLRYKPSDLDKLFALVTA
jgi:hypothetical protein